MQLASKDYPIMLSSILLANIASGRSDWLMRGWKVADFRRDDTLLAPITALDKVINMKQNSCSEEEGLSRCKRSCKTPAALKNAFLTAYTEDRLTIK